MLMERFLITNGSHSKMFDGKAKLTCLQFMFI